ncbi:hypothetical protein CGRA01v4_10421 [Colletotrichum graminicola]|nr:hypothetical protein CGRA01v4_10421 [Colletotrichum graminicola]
MPSDTLTDNKETVRTKINNNKRPLTTMAMS